MKNGKNILNENKLQPKDFTKTLKYKISFLINSIKLNKIK